MDEKIRLTKQIHKFVRNQLDWEESLKLLDEIVDSNEWMDHLEIDMAFYWLANRMDKDFPFANSNSRTMHESKHRHKAIQREVVNDQKDDSECIYPFIWRIVLTK